MNKDISSYFDLIPDPRVVGRCDHLLSDILLIAICTYLTGGSDYQEMHLFGKERGKDLDELLELPNGVPSADTFERVFKRLEPKALEDCMRSYGRDILSCLSEKQIVIDGKKQRGVSPTSLGNSGLYLLNAWVSENKFCIAQTRVEDKSNEITAIPELLESIDITGSIVSIDAIGTQRKIAEQIIDKDAHYLLSVKGNQQDLLDDVACAFKTHNGYDIYEELDYGHGRIETRKCSILKADQYLLKETIDAWKNVSTLVKVESMRELKGVKSQETRYYISDEDIDKARYYNSLVRDHWSIENQLHWHLDVTFKEDACRARMEHAPENLSIIRKFALQIITKQKDKLSLKKRQFKAALNNQYLIQLLKF